MGIRERLRKVGDCLLIIPNKVFRKMGFMVGMGLLCENYIAWAPAKEKKYHFETCGRPATIPTTIGKHGEYGSRVMCKTCAHAIKSSAWPERVHAIACRLRNGQICIWEKEE